MNKLRIAHIGWLSSTHLQRRVTALTEKGLYTVVITDRIPDLLIDHDLPFHAEVIPEHLTKDPIHLVNWISKILVHHKIDVLHIHSTHYPASLGFFVPNIPRLTSIWDFVHSRDPVSPLFHKVILDQLINGHISETVSFSSPVIKNDWESSGLAEDKSFLHSWGVNRKLFSFKPSTEETDQLRKKLSIPHDDKIIFSPRTPSLPANNDLLLQALPLLDQPEKVTCIITGHCLPPETRYLERTVAQNSKTCKIKFIDPVHDTKTLSSLYTLADLVVSLHSNDHNPATVLEAMVLGSTILINQSRTVEYWIEQDRNGFVAKTRNLPDLVEKIKNGLNIDSTTKKRWQKYNFSKISQEANFEKTIDILIKDYHHISNIKPIFKDDCFLQGLLHDINSNYIKAKEFYHQAKSQQIINKHLEDLLDEKKTYINPLRDAAEFHATRSNQIVYDLYRTPKEEWEKQLSGLEYSNHLFRHDIIAGLYPLVSKGRYQDIITIIDLIAKHFRTDTLEWYAEFVTWFGSRWKMWNTCAQILLSINFGGSSLAPATLMTAKQLGHEHPFYIHLLKKAQKWSDHPITHISKSLDERFRANIYDESCVLLNTCN